MEIKVIKLEDNVAEFKILGEDHAFANVLREKLLENSHVVSAAYSIDHPVVERYSPRFYVETDGKVTPMNAVRSSASKLKKEFKAFLESFEGAFEGA